MKALAHDVAAVADVVATQTYVLLAKVPVVTLQCMFLELIHYHCDLRCPKGSVCEYKC